MWLKLIITAIGLGVVLYFQYSFDMKDYISKTVEETEPRQTEMARAEK